MTREQKLDILIMLSAIESWSFADRHSMPDYLHDRLDKTIDMLRLEVLNGSVDTKQS